MAAAGATPCGYGAAWKARRPTPRRGAAVVGYYQGFGAEKGRRPVPVRGTVIRGGFSAISRPCLTRQKAILCLGGRARAARVLGHIGMVQTIFDITDIPAQAGDPVRIEINPLLVKGMDVTYE